jgi:hypothetical protein
MRKIVYLIGTLAVSLGLVTAVGAAERQPQGVANGKVYFCVENTGSKETLKDVKFRAGTTCPKGMSLLVISKNGIKGATGARGPIGPAGPDSPDPNDPEIQDSEVQEAEVQEAEVQNAEEQDAEIQEAEVQDPEVNDPDPDSTLLRLTGDFGGSNASVATSLDGVQFGPYPNAGWGGSVFYTGADGQTLDSLTQLSFTAKHSSGDDSPIAAPYLRIFLEGGHDVIYDATMCATTVPAEDVFTTYQVVGSDVRYDDDSCDGVPPDQQTWAAVVAAHGDEIIDGIYVTTGFAGGAPLAAILRSLSVNGTVYTFGAA